MRGILYAKALRFHHERLGVLKRPPEPVIGRRFAPTRWRTMTVRRMGEAIPINLHLPRRQVMGFAKRSTDPLRKTTINGYRGVYHRAGRRPDLVALPIRALRSYARRL